MADLAVWQQAIGVSFQDPSLLKQALLHSSYINEAGESNLESNEKLEFLGDAVLGLVIAAKLYRDFPQFSEGQMTRVRAALVRQDTLAEMARAIEVGDYLCLGKGEEASGGRSKPANLASALEAVIAAVFLDQGLAVVRDFILKLFREEMEKAVNSDAADDYKSRLQELVQGRQRVAPVYHLISAIGSPHDRIFTVEVSVNDAVLGRGSGKSKKLAETEAARQALERLSTTP